MSSEDRGRRSAGASPELGIVRESLTSVLAPELVSRILFDALRRHRGGEMPRGVAELGSFVEGPLVQVIDEELGEQAAASALEQLRPLLYRIAQGVGQSAPPPPRRERTASDQATRRVSSSDLGSGVMIVSKSRVLELHLEVSFGARLVADTTDEGRGLATALAHGPGLWVLDAVRAPSVTPLFLAEQLGQLRPRRLTAIWGSTRPYALLATEALTAVGLDPVTIDEADRVEPLMDLVSMFLSS
ncbi:MAG: hypothetical protein OEY14_11800 [Myxococcales bacterium]|nr:hypothetical protein [Myxococcales bacterium]